MITSVWAYLTLVYRHFFAQSQPSPRPGTHPQFETHAEIDISVHEFYCKDVVRSPEVLRVIETEMTMGLRPISTSICQLDVFHISVSFRWTYSDRVE